ncbi:MAG: hypothetical protein Q8R53_02210 [Nanoarchaeota archaeon]|nr:hypothetical protein [Nanoarchaeota archaeon]
MGGVVGSLVAGVIVLGRVIDGDHKRFPDRDEAQAGYIPTSQLEVEVQNFDGIEGDETILRINGVPYGLVYDASGEPDLVPYQTNPQRE